MDCRYCQQPIIERRVKTDDGNRLRNETEWVHVLGSIFCQLPKHLTNQVHTARPNEDLSVAAISRMHTDAEISTYIAGSFMPYVCFVHTTELWNDRMRLVTHTYQGWERDSLSLERTDYAY